MIYNDNSCLSNKKTNYYVKNTDTTVNKYTSYTNYNKNKDTDDNYNKVNINKTQFIRHSFRKNSPK